MATETPRVDMVALRAIEIARRNVLSTVEMAEIISREYAPVVEALAKYEHCRHACVDCFCTKEAKAAMRLVRG